MHAAFNVRRLALVAALLAVVSWTTPGRAQMHDGVELVKAELIADTTAVAPGKPFTVGLRLKMAPHWHTYWQYSGDAGLPTKITWQLPDGFKAGPIQWPVPEKIVSPGDIINYGYDDEVVLLTEITPPAQLPAGEITLKGKADWLVCADICVPGSGPLSLSLPEGTPAANNAEVFKKYRQRLPQPFEAKDAGFDVQRKIQRSDLVLTVGSTQVADFFPLPSGDADAGHATFVRGASNTQITVPVTTGAADVGKLGGVLTIGDGEGHLLHSWTIAPGTEDAKMRGFHPPTTTAGSGGSATNGGANVNTGGNSGKGGTTGSGATGGSGAAKATGAAGGSLLYFLLLGFIGGLILNVMPCVLPVISLKLFSFIKQSNEAAGEAECYGWGWPTRRGCSRGSWGLPRWWSFSNRRGNTSGTRSSCRIRGSSWGYAW